MLLPVDKINLTSDGAWYSDIGLNLYHGHGLTDIDHSPVITRPLFPVLLAFSFSLFGPSTTSAFATVRVFYILIPLLVYLLGKTLFNRYAGLIASLFVLTSYSLNEWSTLIHLDYILPFFLLLFIELCIVAFNKSNFLLFAASGLVLGLSYLLKEISILFLPSTAIIIDIFETFP